MPVKASVSLVCQVDVVTDNKLTKSSFGLNT
ncbi:Uncharacterised protein [Vibrio cholerae]|nr:Uncharacterised protein [Vibrio cholerae]